MIGTQMIGTKEIGEVVRTIWECVLGIDVAEVGADFGQGAECRTAIVQLSGAWEGAIVCIASDGLIRRVAYTIFGTEALADSAQDLRDDAVGELANMIGGNLKALLPEPSTMSLPVLVAGSDHSLRVPLTRLAVEANFVTDGEPLAVRVFEKKKPPARLMETAHAPKR